MATRSDKEYWGSQFSDREDSFDDSLEFETLQSHIKNKYKKEDGYELIRHPIDVYGPDAILYKDGVPFIHFAFERRGGANWYSGEFRYGTLHIPANKDYLINWAEEDNAKFVSLHFCQDLSRAFYAKPEVILESPVVKISCKSYNGRVMADHRDLPVNKLIPIIF